MAIPMAIISFMLVFTATNVFIIFVEGKTVFHGSKVEFSCTSNEPLMWLQQSHHQTSLTGIAYGDKPKSRFSNVRFELRSFWLIVILWIKWEVCAWYHAYQKKKDAPGHLLIEQTKKIVQKCFHWGYFEDFQIFFQSRPVPGLYLKPFKSYSQSKTTTILNTWQNTKSLKKLFIVSLSYEIT